MANDDYRLLIHSFEADDGGTALTITAAIEALLSAEWADRWEMLRDDPRLLDTSVARKCDTHDLALGDVIRRAAIVDVATVRSEFRIAQQLSAYADRVPTTRLERVESDLLQLAAKAIDLAVNHGARWLLDYASAAISATASVLTNEAKMVLRPLGLAVLSHRRNVTNEQLQEAWQLAISEWQEVWERLRTLDNAAEWLPAVRVLHEYAACFKDEKLQEWFSDLEALLTALIQRGPDKAITEHQSVLSARALLGQDGQESADLARACWQESMSLGILYRSSPSRWVADAGLLLAERARELCPLDTQEYPLILSNIARRLSDAADAGVVPNSRLIEAVDLIRQTLKLLPENSEHLASATMNLSVLIGEAVGSDIFPPSALTEAVDTTRMVVNATRPKDPLRPSRLTSLGNRISAAVQRGGLDASYLLEAIDCHREVAQLTRTTDALHIENLILLSQRIGQGVRASILPVESIDEAVAVARRTLDMKVHAGDDNARRLSNLAWRIQEAIDAGRAPYAAFLEVVAILTDAAEKCPSHSKLLHEILYKLSQAISESVDRGLLPPTDLSRSIDAAWVVYNATPVSDVNRGRAATNLASRTYDAVQGRTVSPVLLSTALAPAREAVILSGNTRERAGRLSVLATIAGEAYRAGIAGIEALQEAVASAREAVSLITEESAQAAGWLVNYSYWLGQAVDADMLPADVLREAVSCSRRATAIFVDGAMSRIERATVTMDLSARLAQAVSHKILDVEALLESLDLAQEVLSLTAQGHLFRSARMVNLAHTLRAAVSAGLVSSEELEWALALYREALGGLSTQHPDWAGVVTSLGHAYAEAVNAGVIEAPAAAADLIDRISNLWTALRFEAGATIQRQRMLTVSEGLGRTSLAIILEGAGPLATIQAIESLRNNWLAVRQPPKLEIELELDPSLRYKYNEVSRRYETALLRFDEGLQTFTELDAIRIELKEAVDEIRIEGKISNFGQAPTASDIANNLKAEERVIYLFPSSSSGYALILSPTCEVQTVNLPALTRREILVNVAMLLSSASAAQDVSSWLWRTVWHPILAAAPDISECLIVPVGELFMLPIHSAGSIEDGWIDERIDLRILPSVLDLSPSKVIDASGSALVAISAVNDLNFVEADLAVASHHLQVVTQLVGDNATRDAVLRALVEAPIALLSGHGVHSIQDGGGLLVVDGVLRADQVLRLPFRRRQYVILGACSSAQIATHLSDEVVGLPRALLWSGFEVVCAALWPVRDMVAFFTVARFFEVSSANVKVPVARRLGWVRQWLRTVSSDELRDWFVQVQQDLNLSTSVPERVMSWLNQFPSSARPLEDPADWAAFTVIG